jgi:glycosyltransferase involved in cell wall biosynthesis
MKVLHCITGLSGDGAQRMLLRLVTGLRDEKIESEVVNLGPHAPLVQEFEKQGIAVRSLGLSANPADAVAGAYRVGRIIDELRPDVIQSWMYHANTLALLGRYFSNHKPPLAWNIRRGLDDFSERSFKTRAVIRVNAFTSRLPHRIIYCSGDNRAQHEAFGFNPEGGCVVENGFDTAHFSPSAFKRTETRRAWSISDDEIVVGNVGRFDVAKGHSYLLRAFAETVKKVPKARLVLIGRGVEGANQSITQTVQELGIEDRVVLLGERDSLEAVYPAFDLYCSASLNEGFPNAISEAMACAVPCVVTDTGASRELVDGIGRVVPSRTPGELAASLVELASMAESARQKLGIRLRERIDRRYSLGSVVRRYGEVYRAVVGKMPTP